MAKVRTGIATIKGRGRDSCEDVVAVDERGVSVIDGIGGTEGGNVRFLARLASLGWSERDDGRHIEDNVVQLDRILAAVEASEGVRRGGACGCFASWDDSSDRLELANVGDTTAVVMTGGGCRYLFDPARDERGRVTCYLGSGRCTVSTVGRSTLPIGCDDFIVAMMSDGAWEYLSCEDMRRCLEEGSSDPQAAADAMAKAARTSGSLDDISVAVLYVSADE